MSAGHRRTLERTMGGLLLGLRAAVFPRWLTLRHAALRQPRAVTPEQLRVRSERRIPPQPGRCYKMWCFRASQAMP